MRNLVLLSLVMLFFVPVPETRGEETDLFDNLSREERPEKVVDILLEVIPSLSGGELYQALLLLAQTEEMLGRPEEAGKHYLQASYASGEDRDYQSMLTSAVLLMETGSLDDAEVICRAVINSSGEEGYRKKGKVLLSRLLYLRGSFDEALQILSETPLSEYENEEPASLLWIYTLTGTTGREKEQKAAQEVLLSRYPDSPETMLVKNMAVPYPTPILFFGLLEATLQEAADAPALAERKEEPSAPVTGTVMIQTGSFRDAENASYHVKDLAEAGFQAEVIVKTVSGTVYHRVVISGVPIDEVQRYLLRLKDKGYEGWPLYD